MNHAYELRVRSKEEGLQLELFQLAAPDTRGEGKTLRVCAIDPSQFASVQSAVARALKNNKYSFSDIKRTRKAPFRLCEEDGIRLDLVFRATKGIVKRSRIEDIMLGIASMEREEAYYWHAKVTSSEDGNNWNGIKALRILLAGE
jgi:hypothetical protein